MHLQWNTVEPRWLHCRAAPQVLQCRINLVGGSFILSFLFHRCAWTDRCARVSLLRASSPLPLADAATEIRLQLAEVFHQPKKPAYPWFSERPMHLRAVLDVLVRYGARVLREATGVGHRSQSKPNTRLILW